MLVVDYLLIYVLLAGFALYFGVDGCRFRFNFVLKVSLEDTQNARENESRPER